MSAHRDYSRKSMVIGERRREPRWPSRFDVAIMPIPSEGGFAEAYVVDFSEYGLGLSVRQQLRCGEQIVVKVTVEQTALLIYTVRNCQLEGERFRIGAAFSGAISSPGNSDEEGLRAWFVARLHEAAA